MPDLYESDIEKFAIELLQAQGYVYLPTEEQGDERDGFVNVVLHERLRVAVENINPDVPAEAREHAVREVLGLSSQSLVENNEAFHEMLTDGVSVEYQREGEMVGDKVWLVDFDNPLNNSFVVCNQFTIVTDNGPIRRADIVLLINGLPFVVMELKNPVDVHATVKKAYTQLQNYKDIAPSLFYYNGVLVASDGLDARMGALTAEWGRFMAWKTVDGVREDSNITPQLETLIKGALRPDVLLDLIRRFTVFEKEKSQAATAKKIAAYHQYHAVNTAVESTIQAAALDIPNRGGDKPQDNQAMNADSQRIGDRKAGIIWHTQGSGKSLSMVFYAGKLMTDARMSNPTLLVITDRNDLDDQLFGTFAANRQLLRQDPIQASNREQLKALLKTAGGGIVFATIQKFFPERESEHFELLSERNNIVVIADEAHRSQYGFAARTTIKGNQASVGYGFAKHLRDALPNASFIGFTATPIENENVSTRAVFGNYIDIYDVHQAIEDGATIPIYYESRLVEMHLEPEQKKTLDAEVEQIVEGEEFKASEKAKAKRAKLVAIVGHPQRVKTIAKDILEHFEQRQAVLEGKGMIVTMSRSIAVALYDEIVKLRPSWQDTDSHKGQIKIIMTSSSDDPPSWQVHRTTKGQRKEISERFKNTDDPLKLVIVRDMWLTGFDAPCLHTMYIDKPMRGHNLMQAIARVNRVYKDQPGGLVVDYIGIAHDLKQALAVYTESGGEGQPTLDQDTAVAAMIEKHEIIVQMFSGFDYQRYFHADAQHKMTIILEAQEHILKLEDGKNRFIALVSMLAKAFALSVPRREAMALKDEVGFFQSLRARLIKLDSDEGGQRDIDIETAIKQIVDKAIVADEVVDIFAAAGIKKPDISILSDEFLAEVLGMKHKNLALELLKKILNDEIKTRAKKNFIQSKKLSKMLDAAINKYKNNLLTASEVIEELIRVAREIRESDKRGESWGLSNEEIAFYDALADNDSAREVMGDDKLRDIARLLVDKVKKKATFDWINKESARATLRVAVKRILREYGYPPDQQIIATDNVLKQAENYADEWVSN